MAKPNRSTARDSHLTLYQQGDVLLTAGVLMPSNVRPRLDGILARGEVTGHAHRLADASDGLLYETEEGTLYLRVGSAGATITHEEHHPVTLPVGDYVVRQVREYDHFAEEARVVKD